MRTYQSEEERDMWKEIWRKRRIESKMRKDIHRLASINEGFLFNECIDIAEVMDIVQVRLRRIKGEELIELHDKAREADYRHEVFKKEVSQ